MTEPAAAAAQMAAGLPMEFERKFLLSDCPPEARARPAVHIEQGWIPGTVLRERLRRQTAADGTVRCVRTIKFGPLTARVELEEDTTPALFEAMWPLTAGARIRKHRYVVADGSRYWEIDVFSDRPLVVAEIELASPDEPVTVPPWLAPYVVREVTGEPAFQNSELARPDP